jgi:F-type H+-transporting ATPase subunit b
MLINWFTVGAQALNFIVLVWLLRRFLYKPVLSAIDAREKRIAGEVADADRQKKENQALHEELQAEKQALDEGRQALIAKAKLEAKSEHERLLNEARREADALLVEQRAAMLNGSAKLCQELAQLAAAESINIARAALKNLAGMDLEQRINEVFMRRLREMDAKTKESMRTALEKPNSEPRVSSSFALSEGEKAAIQAALNETCATDVRLRFDVSSKGISGIDLYAEGQRLSWTLADYLNTLEEKALVLLRADGTASSDAAPDASPAAAIAPAVAA